MGNLLGEPFKEYVNEQIRARQKVHGKKTRTVQELQYLNSKNAWIKLASGTYLFQERLDLLQKTGNPLVTGMTPGVDLAVNNVLFNGLSSFGDVYKNDENKKIIKFNQTQRSGITGDEYKRAYGVGGTQQYGYSPMPGILDANIKDLNRGSIKRATLNIKAHNRNQFDVIDALYLRLGYTVLLEWGNDKYLDKIDPNTGEGIVSNMGTTLADKQFFKWYGSTYEEVLPAIENLRKVHKGNYDGMFGVISNFSWTFESDGSYNIKLELISQGDVIESLKANLPVNENGSKSDSSNGNGNGNTLTNEYRKLFLSNIVNEPLTNSEAFYDDLYPGLEGILKEWYDGSISGKINEKNIIPVGKAEFNVDVDNLIVKGTNFPTLKIDNYASNQAYKDKYGVFPSQENVNNVIELFKSNTLNSNTSFVHVLNSLIYGNSRVTGNVGRTIRDIDINKVETVREDVLNSNIGGIATAKNEAGKTYRAKLSLTNPLQGEFNPLLKNTRFDVFWEGLIEARLAELEKNGVEFNKEDIARKIILQNIGFNKLKLGVFEFFRFKNRAGGAKDPQFASEQPEENQEPEETAEIEAEKQLEANKDKNKVFSYLYDIRKVWDDQPKNFTFSGGITIPEKVKIGSIINPTGTVRGEYKPIWNKKVGFPIYPRANEGQSTQEQLQSQLMEGSIGDIGSKQPNAADIIRLNLQPLEKQYFIRLGVFLEYLEKKVIPKIKSGSNKEQPMLLIDYHPQNNICYTIDNLISLNPNKLIIKNQNFYNGSSKYEKIFPELKNFKSKISSGFIYGNIMNIYLNFDRIEELFDGVDENNQVSIFEILKNIAIDINESLGNVNNIEPVIDKETNTITFIDQTSIPGLKEIAKTLEGYKRFDIKEPTLEIFGYNQTKPDNPTSNFVRSAGITTEISKEYATIITIGATANGAIPGAESTAFSKWNVGIQDRFKTNIVDGEDERNSTIQKQNALVLTKYSQLISRTYGKLGLTKDATNDFNINNDLISLNKSLASNYYIYAQAQTSNSTDSIESSIGFIPFNLKLEMDGLSGVKIYNRVKVNTSFLPTNYGETLSFIVTGVNHKLSGNEWVTNLDTIATTKDKFSK